MPQFRNFHQRTLLIPQSTANVHIRVIDAASGQPTPVRLYIGDDDGNAYVPFGYWPRFPTGRNESVGAQIYWAGKKYSYIDGGCEAELPVGVPLTFEISKGPEYQTIRQTTVVKPGQLALRFAIERWIDSRENGWESADLRCHFLSPHDALLQARAEGLGAVHLLLTEHDTPSIDGHLYRNVPHLAAFGGQRPVLDSDGTVVYVNTLNSHPALGRVALLHSHRPIFPLSFGDDGRPDDWSICDWCDQCHRKGGLTVWSEPFKRTAGEALVAAILGKIDAIEWDAADLSQPFLPAYYRLLNAGIVLPLVGSSGKDSNRMAMGSKRTYTRLPNDPAVPGAWVPQIKSGQSFVTDGPLLDWHVGVGHNKSVIVDATARHSKTIVKLEVVANGVVVAISVGTSSAPFTATLTHEFDPDFSGWWAIRCRAVGDEVAFAHSSPNRVEGRETIDRRVRDSFVRTIENVVDWVENVATYADPRRRVQMLERCRLALDKLALNADSQ